MKYLYIFLFTYFNLINLASAKPTEDDRQKALELMYTLSSDQDLHFIETSNYETVQPRWVKGLLPSSCAYSNTVGKGYILTVKKIEQGKVWIIQRHFGDADPFINSVWTCANCNGENYEIREKSNEHGLCNV